MTTFVKVMCLDTRNKKWGMWENFEGDLTDQQILGIVERFKKRVTLILLMENRKFKEWI